MEFLKSRFNPRDPSLYALCVAIVCGIAAAILYPLTGTNEFNENISTQLVVMNIVAIVVAIAAIFFRFKEVRAAAFFLFFYDLIIYAGTQGNYIANILTAIDGSSASPSLIITIVVYVVAMAASIASMILLREAPAKKAAVEAAPKGE